MKSVGWHSKGHRYGQEHWCASESRTALVTQTFLNVYACGHLGPLVSFHRGFDICVLSFPAGLQESSRVVPVPLQYAISLPQSAAHLQYLLVPVG